MIQQSHCWAYTLKVKVKSLSSVRLFAVPWTVAYQAPLSMGFSRQEYWSGLPFPSLKEAVVHIHNGILLSHERNTFESVLMKWMNLEPITESEVRKINIVF